MFYGAKGGGGSTFKQRPDTLRSNDVFEGLLGLCAGPIKGPVKGLKSIRVDGTPIEDESGKLNFENFTAIWADGDPAKFPQQVNLKLGAGASPVSVNLSLSNTNASGPGPWVTKTLNNLNCDFIDLRFVVSQLYRQDKRGVYEHTANLEIQMKPVGSTNWISPFLGTPAVSYQPRFEVRDGVWQSIARYMFELNGSYQPETNNGYFRIQGKATSAVAHELRVAVPNEGQYADRGWDIRVRLIEKESVDADPIFEKRTISWESAAAGFDTVFGITEPWRGLSWLQIYGKASDQLSQTPEIWGEYDTLVCSVPPATVFNPETREYTGALWDGSWAKAYTNDPAWCINSVITDSLNGLSLIAQGSYLNKWDALEVSKYCSQMVPDGDGGFEPRFSLNLAVEEPQKAKEFIQYMAGAVSAIAWEEGLGEWRMRIDKPELPVDIFTLESVVGEFHYSHTDVDTRFNDITVVFRNKEFDYREDRVRVQDQGHIDRFGRKPTTIVLIGCTGRQEALRRAILRLRSATREIRQVSFTTNRRGRMLQRLDTILVADADLAFAGAEGPNTLTTGRIVYVSSDRKMIQVRDPLRLETGANYKINLTIPNPNYNPEISTDPTGTEYDKPTLVVELDVANTSAQRGDVTELHLASALPVSAAPNANIALVSADLPALPKSYRVIDVVPDNEQYAVTAIEVDTGKYAAADNGVVESSEFQGPLDAVPEPIGLQAFIVDFEGLRAERQSVNASWDRPAYPFLTGFRTEYRVNQSDWVLISEKTQNNSIEMIDPTPGQWEFRVYSLDRRGTKSLPVSVGIEVSEIDPGALYGKDSVDFADGTITNNGAVVTAPEVLNSELQPEIDAVTQAMLDLEAVFGTTQSAEASAAAAAAARTAAEQAKTDSETARNQSQQARDAAENILTATQNEASDAESSAHAAAASASTASTKATEAENSATSASGSANIASTKAVDADNSASAAAGSASAAGASQTAAGNSASAANQSKLDAAASQSAAAGSATAANTSAGSAAASATGAGNSASAANQSKLDAQAAAGTATAQAGIAQNQAVIANDAASRASSSELLSAGYESSARTQAEIATTQATNAATNAASATAASNLAVSIKGDVAKISGNNDFDAGLEGWSQTATGSTLEANISVLSSSLGWSNVLYAPPGVQVIAYSKKSYPVSPGFIYQLDAEFGAHLSGGVSAQSLMYFGVFWHDANGNGVGTNYGHTYPLVTALYLNNGSTPARSARLDMSTAPAGAVGFRLYFIGNYYRGALGTYVNHYRCENITARVASETAASNSALRLAEATAEVAKAQNYAKISANVAVGLDNPNARFFDWPTGQSFPTDWGGWAGSTPTKHTTIDGTVLLDYTTTNDADDTGARQLALLTVEPSTWYIAMWKVELVSGSLSGSGIALGAFQGDGTTYVSETGFPSATTRIDGVAPGDGVVGRTYTFAAAFKTGPNTRKLYTYIMNNYFATKKAKQLRWYYAGIKKATPTEVAMQTTVVDMAASISSAQLAIADLTTNKASVSEFNNLSVVVGGHTSTISNQANAIVDLQNNKVSASTYNVLATTVAGHTASVAQFSASIDGLYARYNVKVNFDGSWAGIELNNGQGLIPEIVLTADMLKLKTSTGNKTPFAVSADKITFGTDIYAGPHRMIFDNGTTMLVHGTGFGVGSKFIEWYGPSMSVANCNEAQAIAYKTVDGKSYQTGVVLNGTLRTANQNPSLSVPSTVSSGWFGSNGGTIAVNASYVMSWTQNQSFPATTQGRNDFDSLANTHNATVSPDDLLSYSGGTTSSCNIVLNLKRAVTSGATSTVLSDTITTQVSSFSGVRPTPGGDPGSAHISWTASKALTYTDPLKSTDNRLYEFELASRTGVNVATQVLSLNTAE